MNMRPFRARAPRTDDALYRRLARPALTTDEIADRAARKSQSRRYIVRWCAGVALVILLGITEPAHTWLRAHLEFLGGVLAGALLQVPGWLRDRWKQRPTHEEFPGGDSCGDDAIRW